MKKPRTDPPADNVGTAAAGTSNAPEPSRCVEILLAQLQVEVSQPTLIQQKKLEESDVRRKQSRLLLSRTTVKTLQDLIKSDKPALVVDREHELPVRVFDWLGREHSMTLKFLDSTRNCRLISGWNDFVKLNNLCVGDRVDIWVFGFSCGGLGMALLNANELLATEGLLLLKDS
uniref:TF-B3 domain-containing protein n=1 Tax=Ananas comosus var. bracteatus TaxID=296719 RepID=A0A6V7QJX8_ANACO|nr:unnamed protein product [Ananas comosus var. bracteatus]